MNLFNYINISNEDTNFAGNGIHIPEGCWINLKRFSATDISIVDLKQQEGENPLFSFCFRGTLEMKIGLARPGYSFTWLCERKLSSRDWCLAEIPLDLGSFTNGTLEISFLGIEESALSFELPHIAPQEITPQNILYDFISPTLDLCCEEQIYYKFSGSNIYYSFEDACVHMGKETSLDLLTYFNAFSSCKWAKYTNIENLSAYIDFMGIADIIIVHKDEFGERNIYGYSIEATQRQTFELPIGKYPKTGLLGIRIFAHQKSILFGGGWLSPDSATQPVHLGIGITTFKREDAVKAAVHRLATAIAAHPIYHDSIDITVVDNGKTLTAEDVPGATLIPNKNLGGTGGFTRSLIHYQESGRHTHCLFMDDDASCEASSIFRSMSFIRHALDPKASLSGAMLFENIQFQQWENGAWFDGGCHPLKHGFDLRDANRLVENELETDKRIYGAWWFFFFPVAEAKNYSLPFFVRGDDIDFSYSNDFKVISLNGVSCWQQDFKTKENAMTVYLFIRSHIVHHLTIPDLKCSFKKVWNILWRHFSSYNNSYFYGTASCVNLAIKHVLEGPKFWEQNMVPTDILKKIKELSACEQPVPYTETEQKELTFADKNIKTRIMPAFLRKLSLNGHLLPRKMIRHTPTDMIYKWMTPNRNRVYMRDQVIMLDELTKRKTVLKYDSAHYLRNLFTFLQLSTMLALRYKTLREQYRQGTKPQRTINFWKKHFGE